MAHVIIVCTVEVPDDKVYEDMGPVLQTELEQVIQMSWDSLTAVGAVGFTLTFEDVV